MRNPYDVLGVSKDADQDAIRKAYKTLARQYHPDLNKAAGAEERFKEINSAYDSIGDPDKRKLFDEFGDASTKSGFDPDRARAWSRGGPGGGFPGGPDFDFGGDFDPSDIFGSMFGGGRAGSRKRRGRDQQTTVKIDPMLAIRGGDYEFVIGRPDGSTEPLKVRIPAGVSDGGTLKLKGQGLPPPGGGPCGDLLVRLQIPEHPVLRRIDDDLEMDVPITVLEAMRGSAITVPTPTGDVRVTVPPESNNGTRLRIKGRGIQKRVPGDLYLVLRPTLPKSSEIALKAAEAIDEAYAGDIRAALAL
jgi:DnaJ-class molecular chaperone